MGDQYIVPQCGNHIYMDQRIERLEKESREYLKDITAIRTSAMEVRNATDRQEHTLADGLEKISAEIKGMIKSISEAHTKADEARNCSLAAKWWAKMTASLVALASLLAAGAVAFYK